MRRQSVARNAAAADDAADADAAANGGVRMSNMSGSGNRQRPGRV